MNLRLLIFLSFYRVCHSQNYLKLTRLLLQHQEDFISSVGNDTECAKQLRLFTKDLNEFRTWTIMMLDSTAKLESGLLQGRVIMMGSYDECLEISDYSNGSYIEGQFCTTTVTPTESTLQCINNQMAEYFQDAKMNNLTHLIDMKWGVCSMSACSPDQLQQLWDFIENRYQIRFHVKFVDNTCYKKSKTRDLTLVDTIAIYIFGVLVLLLLSSTLYDILFFQQKHEKKWNLWVTFSLYNNAKRLLSTKKEDETNITCLYGIRVIFMAWIVLGHSYFIYLYMMSVNNIQLITLLQQDSSMFILGAYASVDTYLLISGCLIVYITSLAKERGTPISLLVFYVHRVLRLSPAYAAVMLISAGPIVYFGSGPFWNNVNQAFEKRCIGGWWQNLLYIQNYYGADAGCLIQGWYLAVDTQLYFISPVIFLLLQKWSKGGIIVTVFLIICSVVVNIVATYYYNIDSLTPQTMEDYFLQLYSRTHFRAAPWLVGTLLGHALLIYRKKRVIMNKVSCTIY
ncbi:hypothetical protein FQA39_LY00505 [Lamprigera yunnana]|nr:hypothetical protein FQA39_LY00505 [Lamprigera yunnana]